MELVNKAVKMLDPFSPNLTLEQKEAIRQECIVNPVYFYDRILGIKASRQSWEQIRTAPNYPKGTPGDHDGDQRDPWMDGFVCEPGIAQASKPGMGELYRDSGIVKRCFIDEWDKLAWESWNLTLMHFAHEMRPSQERVQARYTREWLERAPEGVESRVSYKDDRYSEPTFEFKRQGSADWVSKFPSARARRPEPSAADIEAGNLRWSQNQLANKAHAAWNLTCTNFNFNEDNITNEKVIETFDLIIAQYDTGEYEVKLTSLIWDEQHKSIWKATPGFGYRKGGVGDWRALDFTPSVRAPSTAFGVEHMSKEELKVAATLAWNNVVKEHGSRITITEAQLECLFDKEVGSVVGYNRVRVKVEAGEPSFSYRVEDQWVPL